MTLLALDNLMVGFRLGAGIIDRLAGRAGPCVPILAGVSLSLARGQTLALVGESGSGKTTLAHAVLGLTPILAGELRLDGQAIASPAQFRALRRRSGMIFQDAAAALSPRRSVGALLAEPFRIHGQPCPPATVPRLLTEVGLPPELARRYPHQLSGGQARRVGVARALALDPDLVIADEPTAGLDVSVQGGVLNLMLRLQRERGFGMILVSHNLGLVRRITDRVAVLYLGRVMEQGPTATVMAAPRHPYTAGLIASEPAPDPRRRGAAVPPPGEVPSLFARPPGCPFHPRCGQAAPSCRTQAPQPRIIGFEHSVACHTPNPARKS